jgi:hypothetical protein
MKLKYTTFTYINNFYLFRVWDCIFWRKNIGKKLLLNWIGVNLAPIPPLPECLPHPVLNIFAWDPKRRKAHKSASETIGQRRRQRKEQRFWEETFISDNFFYWSVSGTPHTRAPPWSSASKKSVSPTTYFAHYLVMAVNNWRHGHWGEGINKTLIFNS